MKVRCITEVSGGVIIAGTTEGLLTFSNNFEQPEEIKFHQNIRNPGIASSLGSNDVINIYTDSRKRYIYRHSPEESARYSPGIFSIAT